MTRSSEGHGCFSGQGVLPGCLHEGFSVSEGSISKEEEGEEDVGARKAEHLFFSGLLAFVSC